MTLSTPQFPLYRLPQEIGALLALGQNGVHAVNGARREPGWHLFLVDLLASHIRRIGDITNCYKGYFRRYLLLTAIRYLISSIHQNGRRK